MHWYCEYLNQVTRVNGQNDQKEREQQQRPKGNSTSNEYQVAGGPTSVVHQIQEL